MTERVAGSLATPSGAALLLNTARYSHPFWAVLAFSMAYEAPVAPRRSCQVAPASVERCQ